MLYLLLIQWSNQQIFFKKLLDSLDDRTARSKQLRQLQFTVKLSQLWTKLSKENMTTNCDEMQQKSTDGQTCQGY